MITKIGRAFNPFFRRRVMVIDGLTIRNTATRHYLVYSSYLAPNSIRYDVCDLRLNASVDSKDIWRLIKAAAKQSTSEKICFIVDLSLLKQKEINKFIKKSNFSYYGTRYMCHPVDMVREKYSSRFHIANDPKTIIDAVKILGVNITTDEELKTL